MSKSRKPGQFFSLMGKLYRIKRISYSNACSKCDAKIDCQKTYFDLICLIVLGDWQYLEKIKPKQ